MLVAIGQQPADIALGSQYVELLQAVRSPITFRTGWTVDAIIWLLLGGSLVIMGGSLRRKAPIMAVIIGISGIAQLIGFLGTLIRLQGTMELAISYSSVLPEQQGAVLNSCLDLWRIIRPHFSVPLLFSGLGFLLATCCFFTVRGFPRSIGDLDRDTGHTGIMPVHHHDGRIAQIGCAQLYRDRFGEYRLEFCDGDCALATIGINQFGIDRQRLNERPEGKAPPDNLKKSYFSGDVIR
jgi:hypothetical protein